MLQIPPFRCNQFNEHQFSQSSLNLNESNNVKKRRLQGPFCDGELRSNDHSDEDMIVCRTNIPLPEESFCLGLDAKECEIFADATLWEDSDTDESDLLTASSSSSSESAMTTASWVPDDLRTPFCTSKGKIPKLLKHDLRRLYPTMFINAVNSHDPELLKSYFERFFAPQTALNPLQDLALLPKQNLNGIVVGRNGVVDYFNNLLDVHPDLVAYWTGCEIIRSNFSHKTSLKVNLKIKWTEMKSTVVKQKSRENAIEEMCLDSNNEPDTFIGCEGPNEEDEYCSGKRKLKWEQCAYEVDAERIFELDDNWIVTNMIGRTIFRNLVKKEC